MHVVVTALASLALASLIAAQQDAAVFHAPLAVLPVDSPPFQRLFDADGDGDLDAVGTRIHGSGNRYQIVIWRNDGGAFTQVFSVENPLSLSPGANIRSMRVEIGDFDGDGRDDVVAAREITIDRYLSRPGFAFERSPVAHIELDRIQDVATGDFDGDGRDDLVVACNGWSTGIVVLHRSNGSAISASTALPTPPRVQVLDLDGDAEPEFGVSGGATFKPFRLVGGALVADPVLTSGIPYNSKPYLWTGGDIDGDGDHDIVVFNPALGANGSPLCEVFRRTGPAAFILEPQHVGGPAEYLADVDGDGDLDGVCCGGGGGGTNYTFPKLDFASTFEIALNDGTGTFARAFDFPNVGSESMAGAVDLDGDGDVDLVAGRCVFYGRGPWLEQPMPKASTNQLIWRAKLLADHDRDGDIDLFPSPYGGALNRGDGTFEIVRESGVTPPTGRAFGGGAYGDFDGDGAVDAIYQQLHQGQFEVMVLARNNGGGRYSYAGPVAAPGLRIGQGYTIDHVTSADCDGDGRVDLIDTQNFLSQVFWNQGGTFVPGPRFIPGRFETTADFDSDGVPDLLLRTGSDVFIARGLGARTFAAPVGIASNLSPWQPNTLAVADVNDDGRPDVLVLDQARTVLCLSNTTAPGGAIEFAPAGLSTIVAVTSGVTIAASDFDGDGRTDVAFGPIEGSPNIAGLLIRRSGNGSILTASDFSSTEQVIPFGGFAVDVDGDGDADLVGSVAARSLARHGGTAGFHRQYGVGTVGEAGSPPVLGVRGPILSTGSKRLSLTNVNGPTIALLGVSIGPADLSDFPLPGLRFLLDPNPAVLVPWNITDDGEGRGAAEAEFVVPLAPALAGFEFYDQAFVFDPAAPSSIASSNGLWVHIGN